MRILILDDDEIDRMAVRRALSASGMDVELVEADTLSSARAVLDLPSGVDAVVADYLLPDGSAADLLRELRISRELPPVVVLTGQGDERVAVDLMKAGASDYLPKSELSPRRLRKILRAAIRVWEAEKRAREAQDAEHRLVAELARERERLERAVAERDEVLAIVSHDLRSPLANVSMALDSLADPTLDPRERPKLCAIADRAVERMVRLIEDLLDVTRIEQGGLALQIGAHDAAQLARDAVDAMRFAADREGIEIDARLGDSLGTVAVDRSRIAQVFQNLLSNALRFTPRGGAIVVRAEAEDDLVRYEVHDDGPGVPPELSSHIFDRFWQARRTQRSGAGLGLAIAKGIVEAHGGSIRLAEAERGARFVFTVRRPDLTRRFASG